MKQDILIFYIYKTLSTANVRQRRIAWWLLRTIKDGENTKENTVTYWGHHRSIFLEYWETPRNVSVKRVGQQVCIRIWTLGHIKPASKNNTVFMFFVFSRKNIELQLLSSLHDVKDDKRLCVSYLKNTRYIKQTSNVEIVSVLLSTPFISDMHKLSKRLGNYIP